MPERNPLRVPLGHCLRIQRWSGRAQRTVLAAVVGMLLAATQAQAQNTHWRGAAGSGGFAAWDTTSAHWTDSAGTTTGTWAGGTSTASFGLSPGTVTVQGTPTPTMGGLSFLVDGYTIAGGALAGASTSNTLSAGSGVSAIVNSALSGGIYNKTGAGTITLGGLNTYTGATNVNAGTLIAANDNALGAAANAATVSVLATTTLGLQGGISIPSTKALSLSGTGAGAAGALRSLNGNNSVGGTITLNQASSIRSEADTLTLAAIAGNSFALTLEGAGAINANGAISGSGLLTKAGSGTATLGVANSRTGAITVGEGTLVVGHANALGPAANSITTTVSSGGTLALASGINVTATNKPVNLSGVGVSAGGALRGLGGASTFASNIALQWPADTETAIGSATDATLTVSGVVSGTSDLRKVGPGTLILSGNNTFSGAVNVAAGVLSVAHNGALGTTGKGVRVKSNATLSLAGSRDIAAGESLILNGLGLNNRGALESVGANTYRGDITLGSTSAIGNSVASTLLGLPGAMDGPGNFVKVGAGDVLLNGTAKSYGGTTTVSTGGLRVGVTEGLPKGSAVTVASGANLTFTTGVSQTLSAGLTVDGTLSCTNGTVTLEGGTSVIHAVAASNCTIEVQSGATLTLGSAITATGLHIRLNGGTLRLGAHSHSLGTLSQLADSVLDFGTTNGLTLTLASLQPNGFTLTVNNWTSGSDHLRAAAISTPTPPRTTYGAAPLDKILIGGNPGTTTYWKADGEILSGGGTLWDGTDTAPDDQVDGGGGTWGTDSNWTNESGSSNGAWVGGGNVATFSNAAGTVNVSDTQSIGGLSFEFDGYLLQGGTLSGWTASAPTVLRAETGVTATVNSKLAGTTYSKQGAGTVVLGGTNDHTGVTTVTEGTLAVTTAGALGTIASNTTVNPGATLDLRNVALQNEPITLSGSTAPGATLATSTGTSSAGGVVTLTGANNAIRVNGTDAVLSLTGQLTSSGGFAKTGTGTLVLSASTNNYTGLTSVDEGLLIATHTNALGTASNTITVKDQASLALRYDSANVAIPFARQLSIVGSGVDGRGVLHNVSGANNSFAGAVTLSGASTIGSLAGSLTLSGNVSAGGHALTYDGAGDITASGVITGTGEVIKRGSGNLVLSGNSSARGGETTIRGGTLVAANTNALGNTAGKTTVHADASLALRTTIAAVEPLTLNGAGVNGSGALQADSAATANLSFAGPLTLESNSTIGNDTTRLLTLSNTSSTALAMGANTLTVTGTGNTTISGYISGTGGVVKTGTGTLLFGSNEKLYTGLTRVDAGTLTLGVGFALPVANAITVASDATLNIGGTTQEFSGPVTVNGKLVCTTGGKLTLTGGSHTIHTIEGPCTVEVQPTAAVTLSGSFTNTAASLTLAGGTLNLAPGTAQSIGTLRLNADSAMDFGGAGAASLTAANLNMGSPSAFALTGSNWTAGSDHFVVTSGITPGSPAKSVYGAPPLDKISLGGNSTSSTYWAATNEVMAGGGTYWDGPGPANNGAVNGGNGTWGSGSPWTDENGTTNGAWLGGTNVATFKGVRGDVAVSDTQSIGGLKFETDGYELDGGILQGAASPTVLTATAGVSATVKSRLLGTSYQKDGEGTVVLGGNNNHTGATLITQGHLIVEHANALGVAGTNTTNWTSVTGGSLGLRGGVVTNTELLGITGTGVAGEGALYNAGGNNEYRGGISLQDNATIGTPVDALKLSGTIATSANRHLTISGAGNTTVAGVISGAGNLIKAGSGRLVFDTNAKTNTGTTRIDAGTLALGMNNVMSSGSAVTVGSGGTLSLGTYNQTLSAGFTGDDGTLSCAGGTLTLNSGSSTLNAVDGNCLIVVSSGAKLGLQGGITTGDHVDRLTVTNSGSQFYNISGDNTFTGPVSVISGGALGSTAGNLTLSGVVSGSVIKEGVGMVTLTNAGNTYGPITVNAGTLRVTGSGALGNASSGATVGSAGTLDLQNVSTDRAITLHGTLSASAGTSTVSSALQLKVGSSKVAVGAGARLRLIGGMNGENVGGALPGLGISGAGTVEMSGVLDNRVYTMTVASPTTLELSDITTTSTNASFVVNGRLSGGLNPDMKSYATVNGILSPGFSGGEAVGTLDLYAVTVNGHSDFQLVQPGTGNSDRVTTDSYAAFGGGATLSIRHPTGGVIPPGSYTLFSGGGSSTSLPELVNLPPGATGTLVRTNNNRNVVLVLSYTRLRWAPHSTDCVTNLGGDGTWIAGAQTWCTEANTKTAWAADAMAVFVGNPGTVTVSGTHDVSVIEQHVSHRLAGSGSLHNNDSSLTLDARVDFALDARVTGTTRLIKVGPNAVTMGGTHDFSGTVAVNAGALWVNGSLLAPTYSVASSATLGGNGSLRDPLGAEMNLVAGSALSPGPGNNQVGRLATGQLTLAGQAVFQLGQANTEGGSLNDLVDVRGSLNLTGSTLAFGPSSGGTLSTGTYTLFKYSGSLTGQMALPTPLPAGVTEARIVHDEAAKRVLLEIVSPVPIVRVAKKSHGGTGRFEYTLEGLSAPRVSVTTVTEGEAVQSVAVNGSINTKATVTEAVLPADWPNTPLAASCVDTEGETSGNGTAAFGELNGAVLTIPASHMRGGALIVCTFENLLNALSGAVFNDGGAPSGGANTGVPNDGLRNGAEAGLSGVAVSLSTCGGAPIAQTVTDAAGHWVLGIPSAQIGQDVCVSAALSEGFTATGANAGGTVLPDGSPVTQGTTSFTYSRAEHRTRITAPAEGRVVLNFGQVPPSTLVAPSLQAGAAGGYVLHPHQFTAGTGGSVQISTGSPSSEGWRELVYLDPQCTGTLPVNGTLLYPPATPQAVVQGQTLCFVVQQFVPGSAPAGGSRRLPVTAELTFSNAPGLSASYTVDNVTSLETGQVQLRKEVRKGLAAWGTNNQAKPGELLEYRITVTNNGISPVNDVVVNDATPAFTRFKRASAGALPTLVAACSKITPGNPGAVDCADAQGEGGAGPIRWTLDGVLVPGAVVELFYEVEVR